MLKVGWVICAGLILGYLTSSAHALDSDGNITHWTAFMHPKSKMEIVKPPDGFTLVPEPTLILDYHFGPVATGRGGILKLYVMYYGHFSRSQKHTLRLFFESFSHPKGRAANPSPSVENWWKIASAYKDLYNNPVARTIVPRGEMVDNYSLGKDITQMHIQTLTLKLMKRFGADARSLYIVLTAPDVLVERFCMDACGTHFYTFPLQQTHGQMVPYGWVGNPATQCPGFCSWPFSAGGQLRQGIPPPNGDVGIDGMIITIGNILLGMATDPYGNGYYMGDAGAPLEAAGACQGIFGSGAYPGFPGQLEYDYNPPRPGFNVYGVKNSEFLLPWFWNPSTFQCAGQA